MPCAKLVVAPGRALILSVAWRRRKGIHSRSLSENYNTKAGLGNRDDADRPDCDRRGAPGAGFAPKRPGRAQKQPRSAMTFLENRDPLFRITPQRGVPASSHQADQTSEGASGGILTVHQNRPPVSSRDRERLAAG